MTDKEYLAVVDRCEPICAAVLDIFGLDEWTFEVAYVREGIPAGEGKLTWMDCLPQWRYQTARIRVNAPKMACLSDAEIAHIFIHEVGHAIVNQMREPEIDGLGHEEAAVGLFTRAVWNALAADMPEWENKERDWTDEDDNELSRFRPAHLGPTRWRRTRRGRAGRAA